ncbi:MAG: L-fuculose-phosphate aldolase [Neofamilia sp.]
MLLLKERELIQEYGKMLITRGLTTGSGGNLSLFNREKGLIAITPSGMDYFEIELEDILVMDINGEIVDGFRKASSETGMHLEFYKHREDINSVVHTHSIYATAIACMGWDLEPVHYMIGLAGVDVKCADYAIYGSMELAHNAIKATGDRNAVLLGNHGLIALGPSLEDAFSTAEHLEYVAHLQYLTKSMGEPKFLSQEQMIEVMKKFKTYKYK